MITKYYNEWAEANHHEIIVLTCPIDAGWITVTVVFIYLALYLVPFVLSLRRYLTSLQSLGASRSGALRNVIIMHLTRQIQNMIYWSYTLIGVSYLSLRDYQRNALYYFCSMGAISGTCPCLLKSINLPCIRSSIYIIVFRVLCGWVLSALTKFSSLYTLNGRAIISKRARLRSLQQESLQDPKASGELNKENLSKQSRWVHQYLYQITRGKQVGRRLDNIQRCVMDGCGCSNEV